MACLMESNRTFLIVRHDLVLTLQTTYDTIHGIHEVLFAHSLTPATSSYQRRLVTYIGDVGTRETRCLFA